MRIFNKKTSKLATSLKNSSYIVPTTTSQIRFKQIGFLALAAGRDDPRYSLELNPCEWKFKGTRQIDEWVTYFPIKFLCFVCGFPILLSILTLIHYSLTQADVTLFDRRNIHPHLKMQSQQDVHKIAHPFFFNIQRVGQTLPGVRDLFHDEIEQALETRRKEREGKK